jgi:hypothetical protein
MYGHGCGKYGYRRGASGFGAYASVLICGLPLVFVFYTAGCIGNGTPFTLYSKQSLLTQ